MVHELTNKNNNCKEKPKTIKKILMMNKSRKLMREYKKKPIDKALKNTNRIGERPINTIDTGIYLYL